MDDTDFVSFLLEKKIDLSKYKTLRSFLTKQDDEIFENGYIGFLNTVPEYITDTIIDETSILDQFIKEKYQNLGFDYHYNSNGACYFLSSIFALSTDFELVQGEFIFRKNSKITYHSWLEKDGFVYDPAFKVVTTKEKYTTFFKETHRHNKMELKKLLQRTGTFTYYIEDLKNGLISPYLKLVLYDTENAKIIGNKIISELDEYKETLTK